jgi:hypothetical protein
MNESLGASAVALHSVAKVLHSQYRATVAAYPANKRQTKIPVTALKASQIARKLVFGSWRIEYQQDE